MTRSIVGKWGRTLAVRLPRDIVSKTGLVNGLPVEIEHEAGAIVIRPAVPRYRLESLLAGMTPEAMSGAFDWGEDTGREAVDE